MRTLLRALMPLAAAGLLQLPAAQAAEPAAAAPRNRLVLQVSDEDEKKWNAVLGNVRNVQSELGRGNVDIEVVAYGPGLGMLMADSLVANRVQDAMAAGVRFVACVNTMTAQKLSREDMIDRIDYVQAGLVRLMQRQQQGWSYIRP